MYKGELQANARPKGLVKLDDRGNYTHDEKVVLNIQIHCNVWMLKTSLCCFLTYQCKKFSSFPPTNALLDYWLDAVGRILLCVNPVLFYVQYLVVGLKQVKKIAFCNDYVSTCSLSVGAQFPRLRPPPSLSRIRSYQERRQQEILLPTKCPFLSFVFSFFFGVPLLVYVRNVQRMNWKCWRERERQNKVGLLVSFWRGERDSHTCAREGNETGGLVLERESLSLSLSLPLSPFGRGGGVPFFCGGVQT